MVTILLAQLPNGGWSICRRHITLFRDLQLGAAIKLAREMAREEHLRLGEQVRVVMPGAVSNVVLANYTSLFTAQDPEDGGTDVLAA